MGNAGGKPTKKQSFLSRDETLIVGGLFKYVSKNSDQLKKDDLMVTKHTFISITILSIQF